MHSFWSSHPISFGRASRAPYRLMCGVAGGNRKGYASYELEPVASYSFWHVKYRVLCSHLGQWTRRDPLDGLSHTYVGDRPLYYVDPLGLHVWGWDPIQIFKPLGDKIELWIDEAVDTLTPDISAEQAYCLAHFGLYFCADAKLIGDGCTAASLHHYASQPGHADAYRHCCLACNLYKRYDNDTVHHFLTIHEDFNPNEPCERAQDTWNNRVGRLCAMQIPGHQECNTCCISRIADGGAAVSWTPPDMRLCGLDGCVCRLTQQSDTVP